MIFPYMRHFVAPSVHNQGTCVCDHMRTCFAAAAPAHDQRLRLITGWRQDHPREKVDANSSDT